MNTSVLQMLKGQPRVKEFLERAAQRPQGGYIFFGPDGVGKRTAALLFAAAINPPSFAQSIYSLEHPDILPHFPFKGVPGKNKPNSELDKWVKEWSIERSKYILGKTTPDQKPSWVISIGRGDKKLVGTIRDLRREMPFPPNLLPKRVALLFDFDRTRKEGVNAFLKTLEEPQANTILVITTSRLYSETVPATIRSRCKIIRFNALPDEVISKHLLNQGFDEEDAGIATDMAFGSLRQAFDYLADKEKYISEPVLSWFEKPTTSSIVIGNLIDKLGWRINLDKVLFSFSFIFRWVLRARMGRLPRWERLAEISKAIESKITTPSLVHNIMLTEKMASRVSLNPAPSLFLYSYLTSLKFN